MTVADLIEKLRAMPQDMPVLTLVDGYGTTDHPDVKIVGSLLAEEHVTGPGGFDGPCVLISYD
jgi:hypothetical protein